MGIFGHMKQIILLMMLAVIFSSCEGEQVGQPGGNSKEKKDEVQLIEGEWKVTGSQPIQPLAVNHHSTVFKVMHFGMKEFHYRLHSTGYQALYDICEYRDGQWDNCKRVSGNIAASKRHILALVSEGNNRYSSTVYDSDAQTWRTYTQTITGLATPMMVAQTDDHIYLVCRKQSNMTLLVHVWDYAQNKWVIDGEDFQGTADWSLIQVAEGLPGEFLIRTRTNSTKGLFYYRYRSGELSLLHVVDDVETVEQQSGKIVPFHNQYILADGRVEIIRGVRNREPLHPILSGGEIAADASGDYLFILKGRLSYSGVRQMTQDGFYIYSKRTGKVYQLRGKALSPLKSLIGPQASDEWRFFIEGGKIRGIINGYEGAYGGSGAIATRAYEANYSAELLE